MNKSYFIQDAGYFYLKGKDRQDFLNRISTNDLSSLKNNEFVKTLLVTDKGKIVDLITVLDFNIYYVIKTTFENKTAVIDYINKYLFTEDVIIEDDKNEYLQITLAGDDIIDFVNMHLNAPKTENNRYTVCPSGSILYFDTYDIPIVRIISEKSKLNDLLSSLLELNKMNFNDFEYFRIQNYIPESVNELNLEVNPMECDLKKYISFTKGCYIGQEVIARLDSQNKLPKQIVRFESEFEMHSKNKIFYRDSKFNLYECGFISSVAKKDNRYLGFAFVRSTYLNYELEYFDRENNLINIYKIN